MNGYRAELLTIARTGTAVGPGTGTGTAAGVAAGSKIAAGSGHGELSPGMLAGIGRRRIAPRRERGEAVEPALRCVSSGYLTDGCSCRAHVPAAVASAAWRSELERGRLCEGFFHFAWRGAVWLAYGLATGRVRGVYCPAHRSEREQRLGYDPELALEI